MPTATTSGIVKPTSDLEPADLYGVATRLADSVEAVFGAVAWTAVTFTNSWVDFGSGYQAAQYRKVGDTVQLRGSVKNGTNGTSVFTLPAGFRPPADIRFGVEANGGFGRAIIATAGTVTVSVGASNAHYSLDGISFSVTA